MVYIQVESFWYHHMGQPLKSQLEQMWIMSYQILSTKFINSFNLEQNSSSPIAGLVSLRNQNSTGIGSVQFTVNLVCFYSDNQA